MNCIPCFKSGYKNQNSKGHQALNDNSGNLEKQRKDYTSWLKIKINNISFNRKFHNTGRDRKKFTLEKPKVVHRGCSKNGIKETLLINELQTGNKCIFRAEYGNYGEDAFFVVQSDKYLLFGVADGVGGWTEVGINPAIFSASLVKHACKNSIKMIKSIEQANDSGCIRNYKISALDLLQAAFSDLLKYDGDKAVGSSTACFGVYSYKTKELNIANLGDSGIYLRTSSKLEFLSPNMVSEANIPLQLMNLPLKMRKKYENPTTPYDADLYSFQLSEGDFFIVGSDGVWDNIDVQNMQSSFKSNVYKSKWLHNVMEKQNMADGFAEEFFCEIMSNSQSLFRYARIDDGRKPDIANHGKLYGGKKDDITLIMVLV